MPSLRAELQYAWYRGAWWLTLLRPLEWVFRAVVAVRHWCYQKALFRSWRAPVPVVVVGNITVGGTGKTPVVVALVEGLHKRGIRTGVVSRGYGAQGNGAAHVVGPQSDVSDCGDEALLLYRRTGVPVVVARDRAEAVRVMLATADVDLVISDDGLQHYRLARDLEIVLYDARLAFGNGRCLPAGPLREPLSRLQSADLVLSRGDEESAAGVSYRYDALVNLRSGQRHSVDTSVAGRSIEAVAGIAHPQRFFKALAELGFQVSGHAFPDHHGFSAEDFSALGDRPIIMTEKDAVKCQYLVGDKAWYVEVSAVLADTVVDSVAALAGQ